MKKLKLGMTVITPAAKDAIPTSEVMKALARHESGDWGESCEHDKAVNDEALMTGGRIMSVYKYNGIRFWIITEHDRSVTTILMPSDY